MNLSSVSVAGATRRPRWQKVDWVERATGPFCRATRPTAERVRRYGIAERFARKTRRQVAVEAAKLAVPPGAKAPTLASSWAQSAICFGEFSPPALPMNLSSVSVAGATRRAWFQKVDWVERATGPFWRATRPTAERGRRYG